MNKKIKNTAGIQAIDDFLVDIENGAFRVAELATKNTVDAMDIVELAVRLWVKKCSHKPDNLWLFLFYKTLYSSIADFERKKIPVNRWFISRHEAVCLQDIDPTEKSYRSAAAAERAEFNKTLIEVLGHLPLPQQQAFLLCEWQGFTVEQVARMLSEAPLIISNRLASALMGLQEALGPLNKDEDVSLTDSIIAALEESAADISYVQQYQLRHSRLQALKQKQAKPIIKWVVASGLMAVCLFVFWWLQLPQQSQEKAAFYSAESLMANELQAWQEDAGLLEDIEFVAWLHVQQKRENEPGLAVMPAEYHWLKLSASEREKARQKFAQWNDLALEHKALLRNQFIMFNRFEPYFQQALREAYANFANLPVEEQQLLRLHWQESSSDVKDSIRAEMENAYRTAGYHTTE